MQPENEALPGVNAEAEGDAPAETASVPSVVRRAELARVFGAGVVGALAGAAAVAFVVHYVDRPREDPRVALIGQQVADLTVKLDQLVRRTAAVEAQSMQLVERGSSVDARPAELDALAKQVQTLSAEVGAQSGAAARSVLALTVGQLRAAVQSGRPFEAELVGLRMVGAGQPVVDEAVLKLAPAARTGIPTSADLHRRFAEMEAEALSVIRAGRDATSLNRSMAWLSAQVPTVLAGQPAPAEGILSRAGARLTAGDLSGAVAALDALNGDAATVAGPWLRSARQRMIADSLGQSLADLAAAKLREGGRANGS